MVPGILYWVTCNKGAESASMAALDTGMRANLDMVKELILRVYCVCACVQARDIANDVIRN